MWWEGFGLILIMLVFVYGAYLVGYRHGEHDIRTRVFETLMNEPKKITPARVVDNPLNEVNLFLDDERNPEDVTWVDIGDGPWTIVRSESEFHNYILKYGIPNKISFDNDLGTGQGEGRFCVNWLIEQVLDGVVPFREFTYTVHSKNNIAEVAIRSKLEQFFEHMRNKQGRN